MEQLLDTGKVRAIGVSNFSIKTLEVLLPHAKVVPVANQVEIHPSLPQHDLVEYCAKKGINLTAYSPLGAANSPFHSEESFIKISDKHGLTVAQVLLSWAIQRGTSAIPNSRKEERLKAMLHVVTLDEAEMKVIDDYHKKPGQHRNVAMSRPGATGIICGWTYEQMGWKLDKKGYALP